MSVAFTFGSFGDILGLIQLSAQVIRALTSTSGASEAYQDLIQDVDHLHNFLQQLDRSVSHSRYHSDEAHTRLLSRDNVTSAIRDCHISLRKILQRVERYRSQVEPRDAKTNGRSWLSWTKSQPVTTWIKNGWGLFKLEEISQFRQEIRNYNMLLTQLLAAMNHDSIQVVQRYTQWSNNAIGDVIATTSVIECNVNTVLRMLQGFDRRMPPVLGYPWETNISSAIPFQDALGRKYLLPKEFCTSPEVIRELMTVALRDKLPNDLRFITWEQSQFWISPPEEAGDDSSNVVEPSIETDTWQECFEQYPGSSLRMSLPVCRFDRPSGSAFATTLSDILHSVSGKPELVFISACSYGSPRDEYEARHRALAFKELECVNKNGAIPLATPPVDNGYCFSLDDELFSQASLTRDEFSL